MDVVAQDLNWLLGCTLSTIPTANFSLCTKPTALYTKNQEEQVWCYMQKERQSCCLCYEAATYSLA